MKRLRFLFILLGLVVITAVTKPLWWRFFVKVRGGKTVENRLAEYGPAARARLKPHFEKASVAYPPARLTFVGVKNRDLLQVYAEDTNGQTRFICTYPILRASGELGPKLKEGDGQVPEGIYRIESLNPNSAFHLSLRVSYPNEFDKEQAKRDGRNNLGGDIMIHGGSSSIGCLAMGDEVAEELFVLAADTGIEKISVLLTPVDFRTGDLVSIPNLPEWSKTLYAMIQTRLTELPLAE